MPGCVGSRCGANGGTAPQILFATASNTNSTPIVPIKRDSGEALRIRRSSS